MASIATERPATRTSRVKSALGPGEWRRLAMMFGVIAALHLIGWITLVAFVAPQHYSLGDTVLGVGVGLTAYTLGYAARVRRRPHRGHRQHHPQADGRRTAPLSRRLLLLARPFQRRLRAGPAAIGRREGHRRAGRGRRVCPAPLHRARSAPAYPAFSCISSLSSTSSSWSASRVFAQMRRGDYDEAALEEQLNNRGMHNRLLGRFTVPSPSRGRCIPSACCSGSGSTPPPRSHFSCWPARCRRRAALVRDPVPAGPVRRRHDACSTPSTARS